MNLQVFYSNINKPSRESIQAILGQVNTTILLKYLIYVMEDTQKYYDIKKHTKIYKTQKDLLELLGTYLLDPDKYKNDKAFIKRLKAVNAAANAAAYAANATNAAAYAAYATNAAAYAANAAAYAANAAANAAAYAVANAASAASAAANAAAYAAYASKNYEQAIKEYHSYLVDLVIQEYGLNKSSLEVLYKNTKG